jgi:hypothetical protein
MLQFSNRKAPWVVLGLQALELQSQNTVEDIDDEVIILTLSVSDRGMYMGCDRYLRSTAIANRKGQHNILQQFKSPNNYNQLKHPSLN